MTWTDKTAFTGEAAAFAGELHDKLAALPSLALSTLDSESTALFVVDMVEGFARQGVMASPRVEALIAPIAALAGRCEAADIPVVAFADTHAPDSLELEVAEEAASAVLFYVAAQCNSMEYDQRFFQSFYAQYQGKMANLAAEQQGPVAVVEVSGDGRL